MSVPPRPANLTVLFGLDDGCGDLFGQLRMVLVVQRSRSNIRRTGRGMRVSASHQHVVGRDIGTFGSSLLCRVKHIASDHACTATLADLSLRATYGAWLLLCDFR